MVWAQKTNTIALTTRSSTLFDMSAITIAGGHPTTFTDNTQWLNYTIRDNTGLLYSLMVSATSGTIPPGMELHIEAGPFYGTGQGGQPTGPKLVSNVPTALVVNMGQGVTGIGQQCGHNIILTIGINNFGLLRPANYPITLLYTFTAQ